MAKKSQCEQCDRYNQESGLCRKSWEPVVLDDTECELFDKENEIFDRDEQKVILSSQQSCEGGHTSQSEITLGEIGIGHMLDIAKWARFLAIVATIGFVSLMVIMVIGLVAMIDEGNSKGAAGALYIIIIIAIYYYPTKKSFDLARHMKGGALQCDSSELENGLDDFRSILKFLGVLTIIMLSFYALGFIIVIIAAIFTGTSL